MKSAFLNKCTLAFIAMFFTQMAMAVTPNEEEEKKCFKPKFRDFEPPHMSEVAPQSGISFHVNRLASPNHISVTAKKIPMTLEIVDRGTFYQVSGNLPAELTGGFARISLQAKALEGDCIAQDGWLVKIVKQEAVSDSGEAEAVTEPQTPKPTSND